MRTVMQHEFGRVEGADVPRSSFNRSHAHKTTFDAGLLVPILVDEAIPGDVFSLNLTAFARLATPIFPILDNLYMDFFFFSVPNRLLWDNWKEFCGEQEDPGDSIAFTIPVLSSAATYQEGDLADYMGLPLGLIPDNTDVSALPFRAYAQIYNEWFRDQNLIDSVNKVTNNGPDNASNSGFTAVPRSRGKRHDYFTSCLPWPAKEASIELPLGTSAPVVTQNVADLTGAAEAIHWGSAGSGTPSVAGRGMGINDAGPAGDGSTSSDEGFTYNDPIYPLNLQADLTAATGSTINALRQSFQIQRLLERDARGGTRYAEIVKSHFGVEFQDVRYRPEYLGGGSVPINITPIANTSDTATYEQGELAGFGIAAGSGIGFTKAFTEHCTIIGLVNVRADLTYQQGLERFWSRSTRYDFFWPALSHIGMQSVLNKEIWVTAADTGAVNDAVFGYNDRFDEYRHFPSRISGLFRSDATGTLEAWHLSQDFATLPVLDATFITDAPPIDRVIATPTEPHFIFDSYFDYKCARPLPLYGTPGLIDHF